MTNFLSSAMLSAGAACFGSIIEIEKNMSQAEINTLIASEKMMEAQPLLMTALQNSYEAQAHNQLISGEIAGFGSMGAGAVQLGLVGLGGYKAQSGLEQELAEPNNLKVTSEEIPSPQATVEGINNPEANNQVTTGSDANAENTAVTEHAAEQNTVVAQDNIVAAEHTQQDTVVKENTAAVERNDQNTVVDENNAAVERNDQNTVVDENNAAIERNNQNTVVDENNAAVERNDQNTVVQENTTIEETQQMEAKETEKAEKRQKKRQKAANIRYNEVSNRYSTYVQIFGPGLNGIATVAKSPFDMAATKNAGTAQAVGTVIQGNQTAQSSNANMVQTYKEAFTNASQILAGIVSAQRN